MITENIKDTLPHPIEKVWDTIFTVERYTTWRSDINKVERINDKQFISDLKKALKTRK